MSIFSAQCNWRMFNGDFTVIDFNVGTSLFVIIAEGAFPPWDNQLPGRRASTAFVSSSTVWINGTLHDTDLHNLDF